MAATEAGFREYLRLPEENRENLALYLNAARSKSRAAGIPEFQDNGHYELFLYTLAGIYYDNRGMEAPEANVRQLINSFVLELRYAHCFFGCRNRGSHSYNSL